MSPDVNQIDISATSRGITDHFFCFTCDEYVWDCDHLIDERFAGSKVRALEPSVLQSFGYDGRVRVLEIEFRIATGAPSHRNFSTSTLVHDLRGVVLCPASQATILFGGLLSAAEAARVLHPQR